VSKPSGDAQNERPVTKPTRQLGPLGEALTDAEIEPIRVHRVADGGWAVDFGSYAQGYHPTRDEAIAAATLAAEHEQRALEIEAE
jgi:hypothetical protein